MGIQEEVLPAPADLLLLFIPFYFVLRCFSFLFQHTHTHTHINILYLEAKTKNKAGVFFSPSLPPYSASFSLLTSTSSLILLYLIIFFPAPRPIFFISLFLPATSFLSNIPLSFPPPNFLPYLHLSFPVSSFCSLLIFLKPFSSLPPHFISLPLSSFPHPFLSFLTSSLCFLSPPPLPTHFLHVSSSLSFSYFSFPSLPPYFFLSPFLSLPPPFLPHILHSCRLIFFSSFVFFPSCLLVYFPPHIFLSLSLPSLSLYFFLPLCPHFALLLIFSASQSPRFFAFLYLLLPSSKCLFLTSLLLFSFPPCPCIILLFSTSHLPIVSFPHIFTSFLPSQTCDFETLEKKTQRYLRFKRGQI